MGERRWWEHGVIYHVYPRSFMDSSGDGIGDLRGITQKLPYLSWLGVDAACISPFYPSPMKDFGYDVSDHKDVHLTFGTLGDFDALGLEALVRFGGIVAAVGLASGLLVATPASALVGFAGVGLGLSVIFPMALGAAGHAQGGAGLAIAAVSTARFFSFLVGPPP